MDDKAKHAQFLEKFHALLAEYGASVSWTCDPCSDTHGIYDEAMTVDIGNTEIARLDKGYIDAPGLKAVIDGGN